MTHAQKPDFVFRRNGRVIKSAGPSVQSTTSSRGVRISGSNGSNAGYTMFRGSAKSTGYPLHSPVSLSLSLPCVTVCHHISTGLYPLDTKKGEPQSQSEQDKKSPDLLEIEHRFLGHPVRSLLVTISEFALLFGNYSSRNERGLPSIQILGKIH